jgi:hypothetical protein
MLHSSLRRSCGVWMSGADQLVEAVKAVVPAATEEMIRAALRQHNDDAHAAVATLMDGTASAVSLCVVARCLTGLGCLSELDTLHSLRSAEESSDWELARKLQVMCFSVRLKHGPESTMFCTVKGRRV